MDASLALQTNQVLTADTLTEELKALFAQFGLDIEALDTLLDPRTRVSLGGWA